MLYKVKPQILIKKTKPIINVF